MRAILTAGGTAGHINPALAIAEEICKQEPDSQILFVGRKDGMEKKLVSQKGFSLVELEVHGLMRRPSIQNLLFNVKSVFDALSAKRAVKSVFLDFKPDVVIGCGGYVSGPVVSKAAEMGIPTAIQEQNAFPGLTTKLLAKKTDRIFVADREARERLGQQNKTEVTGNPIRQAFFETDRSKAREALGIGEHVLVLSFGGSNGATSINRLVTSLMSQTKDSEAVLFIHATGHYTKNAFPLLLTEKGIDPAGAPIRILEYIDDMPQYAAAADLIICRAGALTVSELSAVGRASVLIPSPNVTENHQYYNAKLLVDAGAARLFEEEDLDYDKAAAEVLQLLKDRERLVMMGARAKAMAFPHAAETIVDAIRRLIEERKAKT